MGILDGWRLTLARCKTELVRQERLLLEEENLLADQVRIKQDRLAEQENLLAEQERVKQGRLAEQEYLRREAEYWTGMSVLEDETRVLAGEGDMKYILAGSAKGKLMTFERWAKDGNGKMYKYREFQRPAPTLIVDVAAGVAFDVRTCKAIADPALLKPEQLRRVLEAGGWPTRAGADQALSETDIIGADLTSVRLVD